MPTSTSCSDELSTPGPHLPDLLPLPSCPQKQHQMSAGGGLGKRKSIPNSKYLPSNEPPARSASAPPSLMGGLLPPVGAPAALSGGMGVQAPTDQHVLGAGTATTAPTGGTVPPLPPAKKSRAEWGFIGALKRYIFLTRKGRGRGGEAKESKETHPFFQHTHNGTGGGPTGAQDAGFGTRRTRFRPWWRS